MDVRTKAQETFPGGIPALMTVKDFAEVCGISVPTAKKMLDKNPGNYVQAGEGKSRMVPARLLFEYLGSDTALIVADRGKRIEG